MDSKSHGTSCEPILHPPCTPSTDPRSRHHQVWIPLNDNTVDPALIDFALRWHHYDNDVGDEDIYPTFGITPGEYRRRLWYALNLPDTPALDEDTRTRLLDYARRYTTDTMPTPSTTSLRRPVR